MQPRSFENLVDLESISPLLPVREAAITQMGPGRLVRNADLIACGATVLYRAEIGAASVGMAAVAPGQLTFFLPVRWEGQYLLNGFAADLGHLFLNDWAKDGSVHFSGATRTTLSVTLPRDRFADSLAALCGVDPDDLPAFVGPHRLEQEAGRSIRSQLAGALDQLRSGPEAGRSRVFEDEIVGLLIDAYLSSDPVSESDTAGFRRASRIVRAAEDRFAAAGAAPISLADLCAAARVGKTTLYRAFHAIVGETPLAYFRKRRLTAARSLLSRDAAGRGRVKRAALGVGLTELGRFSVEYRQLFGESPSATRTRAHPG
jgi:AraC-like DNA-binding protein